MYIGDINKILSGANNLNNIKIKITTNGHFAKTKISAIETLSSFLRLNTVQLSYDKFHAKFLPFSNIKNLFQGCQESGLKFSIILTIQSPLEIAVIKKLWKVGQFPIGIQKVLPIGQASKNRIEYMFPSFDRKVLSKFCPNRSKIKYLCGQGFSMCCSSLAYNKNLKKIVHPSIAEHLRSKFYKLISSHSFSELAKKFNVSTKDLPPQYSSQCNLCEYIFQRGPAEFTKA